MLKKPFVFAYNILESKFLVFGNSLLPHIAQIFAEEGCEFVFLPIRNGAYSDLALRISQVQKGLAAIGDCHLVGYSVAGLDCRLALNSLKSPISSLTTIASPHRGSHLAYWANTQDCQMAVLEPILNSLGLPLSAFKELTPRRLKQLNKGAAAACPTFSIAAWKDPTDVNPLYQASGQMLQQELDYERSLNDGVFTVDECLWGQHLLTFDADHGELVGTNLHNPCGPVYRLVTDNVKHVSQLTKASA